MGSNILEKHVAFKKIVTGPRVRVSVSKLTRVRNDHPFSQRSNSSQHISNSSQ
jgi:hypothetical protein